MSRGARHRHVIRWLKFNAVGALGIAVQLAVLFGLKTGFHLDYLLATALAVEAAVVHNFLWHERYTWADRVQPSWRKSLPRLLRFNLTTGAVSIAGNLALMKFLVGLCHLNYVVASAIAIALCSLANFLVSDRVVFGQPCSIDGAGSKSKAAGKSTLAPHGLTQSLAQPSHNSSLPAAACNLLPRARMERLDRSPARACVARSISRAASMPVP
jgi:putative flippase GtrA